MITYAHDKEIKWVNIYYAQEVAMLGVIYHAVKNIMK